MTTVDQFLDALAQVESSNNPAAWGDNGKAMGRWQVHPDRLWSEAGRWHQAPRLDETWDSFVRRVLTAMYDGMVKSLGPVSVAMYWHKGHTTDPSKDDWDLPYATKMSDAMARALGQAIT